MQVVVAEVMLLGLWVLFVVSLFKLVSVLNTVAVQAVTVRRQLSETTSTGPPRVVTRPGSIGCSSSTRAGRGGLDIAGIAEQRDSDTNLRNAVVIVGVAVVRQLTRGTSLLLQSSRKRVFAAGAANAKGCSSLRVGTCNGSNSLDGSLLSQLGLGGVQLDVLANSSSLLGRSVSLIFRGGIQLVEGGVFLALLTNRRDRHAAGALDGVDAERVSRSSAAGALGSKGRLVQRGWSESIRVGRDGSLELLLGTRGNGRSGRAIVLFRIPRGTRGDYGRLLHGGGG